MTETRGDRMRVWFDAATVMLGTAVFVWHFLIRPALRDGRRGSTPFILGLLLMAVFAVAKVALSGGGLIDSGSLRLFGVALLGGAIAAGPQQVLLDSPRTTAVQYAVPVVLFFISWGADSQRRARGQPFASRRDPFSVLPYGAVVAVDGLLLYLVWVEDPRDLRGVAVGAVGLTALVLLRQASAFRENGLLLARLHHGATHDALTQLPNRTLFAERLQAALSIDNSGRPLSVALIDLDDFKLVNDGLGHAVGDSLLIEIGKRLASAVCQHDTVARLGGDEFVVVLDGTDPVGADIAVSRLLSALSVPVVADGHELLISASIGVADGRSGADAAELLRQADVAMYAAKKQGGAGHLHYLAGMTGGPADNAHLGAELRQALAAGDQLHLVYQPIVTLDGGRLSGVEALVRWRHPDRGEIGPAGFIPVAERTGLVVPLGRWVLREACRQAAEWTAVHGIATPMMNVNVSARELREIDFPDFVADVLAETGLAPGRLVLEITETTVFALGASVVNLHALRRMGTRIALDDFGTGQSTLTLLQDCPVDELKLDRSFAQFEAGEHNTMAVAVIHLAQALGLGVVAEGVETYQQAERLRLLSYPVAQGFCFGRPMPASELGAILDGGGRTPVVAQRTTTTEAC
jgi:diguanylate cyclase (GGDEF)-like protein